MRVVVDNTAAVYPITWTAESDQAGAGFGGSVGTAGDVNGDGYADVIAGAPGYDNGQTEGRVFVYHGSVSGLNVAANWTAESDQAGAGFGGSVGTAGDVNGDSYADVIVGAHWYNNGRAFVYYGSAAGLSTTADWMAESDQANTWFGWSVGTAGDVNGDGYADVTIGERHYGNIQGRALVYHGSTSGLSATANWTAESDQPWAYFGTSVGTAGDVNGDSYDDVIVGAPGYTNAQVREGGAFVYYGSPPPDIEVTPTAFEATVAPGEVSTQTMTINNVGAGTLAFDIAMAGTAPVSWQPISFPAEKVESGLRQDITSSSGQGTFLVYFKEQADLSKAYSISDWTARGQYVYKTLWNTARKSQAGLLNYLDNQVQLGAASSSRSYYIVNAALVTADIDTLDALAARSDVAYIEAVKQYHIPEPVPGVEKGVTEMAVEWGVAKIRANQVWTHFGVRGEGIVVANIDTGVLSSHSALVSRYRGTTTGSHDYNWFDPTGTYPTAPGDDIGHGTHTMGTMIGDDSGGCRIGVAPAAQWIAAKGCANDGCSSSDLLAATEWVLAPYPIEGSPAEADPSKRPHVVNNSWAGPGGNLLFQASVAAWRAAGIFPALAAGNSGPDSGTIGSPADYAESFASGATNSSDMIDQRSGRGPSSLTSEIKPDVSAPGVDVSSAWNNGGYHTLSGTSMASPHTAGCAALILSAIPSLSLEVVENLMTSTAIDLGTPGPDYDYGYGRLDCYEAVAKAVVPWLSVSPTSGTLASGSSQDIAIVFNADGLTTGTYTASFVISNNDPDESPVRVPVTMTVESGGPAEKIIFLPVIMKE